MAHYVDNVVAVLLKEIQHEYAENKCLSDETLERLWFMFKKISPEALKIIDANRIKKLCSPSGRTLYQIEGNNGNVYTCFSQPQFCPCYFFHHSVLKRSDMLLCKHILAIRLAEAMNLCNHDAQLISNEELAARISGMWQSL